MYYTTEICVLHFRPVKSTTGRINKLRCEVNACLSSSTAQTHVLPGNYVDADHRERKRSLPFLAYPVIA